MSYFCVTSSKLRQSAEDLTVRNRQFAKNAESLDAAEAALKGMWEGSANEAFHAAFQKDRGVMDAFSAAIEQYVQALLLIAQKYDEAEAKNMQIAGTRNY